MILAPALRIAALVASAIVPEPATRHAPRTHVVASGETCLEIARKMFGDTRRIDVLHRLNPGLGRSPHKLTTGQVLLIGEGTIGPADLSFLRNRVFSFTPVQHPGTLHEPLSGGDRVSTQVQSNAEITFSDRTRLQLGENTLIVMLEANHAVNQTTGGRTTLERGRLRAFLGALDAGAVRPLEVSSGPGGARATVESGEAQLRVDDVGATTLAVHRGRSRLTSARHQVLVPKGYGSRAELGKAPSPPSRLPAPPVWQDAPPALLFAPEAGALLDATYAKGEPVAPLGWHVQLAREERFNDLVTDVYVPGEIDRLHVEGLAPGLYHSRVAALDAYELEGSYGTVSELRVVRQPQLQIESDGNVNLVLPADVYCALDGGPIEPTGNARPIDVSRAHSITCAATSTGAPSARFDLEPQPTIAVAPSSPPLPSPVPMTSPSPPSAIPHRAAARATERHVSLLGGPQIEIEHARTGGQIALEIGRGWAVSQGVFRIAARLAFEWQAADRGLRAGCSPAEACRSDHGAPYGFSDRQLGVSIATPLSYRVLSHSAVLSPVLGLLPLLLVDISRVQGLRGLVETARALPGLGAYLGLEVRLRGALSLEVDVGYRRIFLEPDQTTRSLSGLFVHGGLRLSR